MKLLIKILNGQLPNKTVYSDDNVLAFYDVSPRARVHVLVIPRGEYTDVFDFESSASLVDLRLSTI